MKSKKALVYDNTGKKTGEMTLPIFFSEPVREDLISKALEVKRTQAPYGNSPMAGRQHSASGKLKHRKSVWKSVCGRGISRVPRKIMLSRGGQFHWEGAMSPNTRGGRRAHPPKAISKMNNQKMNKKELRKALMSAIAATSDSEEIKKKYSSLQNSEVKSPVIIKSDISKMKAKQLLEVIQKIFGEEMYEVCIKNKRIRSGRGKLRGRKYKKNAGILFVVGHEENVKNKRIEIVSAKNLSIEHLASGGQGRITVYTETGIKELEERIKGNKNVKTKGARK